MKSLKIRHTVATMNNYSSGVTYCVNSLVLAQLTLSHESEIWTTGTTAEAKVDYKDTRIFSHNMSTLPIFKRLYRSVAMKSHMQSANFDILHTHGLWSLPNTYFKPAHPFVLSPHGMLSEVALGYSRLKKRAFQKLFQQSALQNVGMLHATAESEYEDIRKFGLRQPVAIIPNGIEVPNLKKISREKTNKTLLYLGRIHQKKGIDILLRAWHTVEKKFPNWNLKIAGPDENSYLSKCKKLAADYSLKRVAFLPPIYGDAKDRLMENADLFILPSRSENFGITIAESLARQVPVITTHGTPWSGVVDNECGWYVPVSYTAISKALNEAFEMQDSRLQDMGRNGREWVSREYSWHKVTTEMIRAYLWLENSVDKPSYIYTK